MRRRALDSSPPAQIADGVVTGPRAREQRVTGNTVAPDSLLRNDIGDRAVTNRELSNPIFTAAGRLRRHRLLRAVGRRRPVADAQASHQVGGGVIYDVGFKPRHVSQCVYSATPGRTRRARHPVAGRSSTPSRAPCNPRIVTVFVRDKAGSFFQPARPSFHLIVVC